MARPSLKQLLDRIEALEEWRESFEEKKDAIGFHVDPHEYEEAEWPETWVSNSPKEVGRYPKR